MQLERHEDYMKRRITQVNKLEEIINRLPHTDKKVIVTHSGGMDSATAVIMCAHHYGAENVISLGYDYGQKQKVELEYAERLCKELGVTRKVLDLSILGEVVKNVSANITGTDVAMPTITDILGNPQPPTYVPYRNMVMFSLTSAFAEANQASHIVCGLQVHDEYSYWDTTQKFVDGLNSIYDQNRSWPLTLIAPFADLSKTEEISLLEELGETELLKYTLTCYDPIDKVEWVKGKPISHGVACGKCPSCSERIQAFMNKGMKDPLEYAIDIPWSN